ncbi:MAG: hypothetical protein AAB131_10245 [Actinomycetota bacterium]
MGLFDKKPAPAAARPTQPATPAAAVPAQRSVFAGIEAAQERRASNYDKPGHYLAKIVRVKLGATRKGEEFLAVEKVILKTYPDGEGYAEGLCHRPGEECSHLVMRKHDSFLPTVRTFIAHVCGVPIEQVDEAACFQACGDDQPLAGLVVETRAITVTTKAKTPFTRIDYLVRVSALSLIGEVPDMDFLTRQGLTAEFLEALHASDVAEGRSAP